MKTIEETKSAPTTENTGSYGKALFWLSLFPYLYLILDALIAAKNGFTFLAGSTTEYGMEAFRSALFIGALRLIVVPVLPAVVAYQLIYLTWRITRKTGVSKKTSRIITAIAAALIIIPIAAFLLMIAVKGL